MRALAAAIQDGRAQLHLTVDELAQRSGVRTDDIWRLLGEDLAAAAPAPSADRRLLEGLAHGLHRDPEVLFRAALIDSGLLDAAPSDGDPFDEGPVNEAPFDVAPFHAGLRGDERDG